MSDSDPWVPELTRLSRAYAGRDANGIDRLAWSPLRPEAHWLNFTLQRFIYAGLARAGWTTASLPQAQVLEVACGTGRVLRWLQEAGLRRLWGCDALPDRLLQSGLAGEGRLVAANMASLPFRDRSMDCVIQVVGFSSCLDPELRMKAASEMLRVLKDGGRILWCDFKPGKREAGHVRGIGQDELRRLFPQTEMTIRSFGVKPGILGRLTSLANQGVWRLMTGSRVPAAKLPLVPASVLESCPWMTAYLGATIRKRGS